MAQYLVLDVGGSSVKYAIADDAYTLTDKGSIPNTFNGNAEFIEAIGRVYDTFADQVSGIAMSTCGELNPTTGEMISGGTLKFNAGTNMIERVQSRCPVPVSVENDGNCALLAEMLDGSLADATNAVVLVIGTAVGGAVMINRGIYHGSHYHSGNASYTMPSLSEPYDPSRIFGFSTGVRGLSRALATVKGADPETLDGRAIFSLLEVGDPAALAQMDAFCSRLATFIYNVQVLLDLDVIAVGGGISVQPSFIQIVRDKVAAIFDASFIPLPAPEIRACKYFNDANLIGALVHHQSQFPGKKSAPAKAVPKSRTR